MERRNFLQGLFGGVTAAGLLVKAEPEAIEAFSAPLIREAPIMLDVPTPKQKFVEMGEHLYNKHGEVVAIVTELTVTAPPVDVTSAFDSSRRFIQGMPRFEIHAHGIGEVHWRDARPQLRGVRR